MSTQQVADNPLSNEAAYEHITKQLGPISASPLMGKIPMVVVVISGPSGVGKDTVIHELRRLKPDLHFVVTAATRPKRANEVDGVDYHFVSKETFEEWIRDDRMFEYATVYGEYKGVPKSQIEEAFARGQDCILRLDVQGAATVRKKQSDCITIYISPRSEDELVKRLIARQTETLDDLTVRIRTAKEELRRASEFDYVVVNEEGKKEVAASQIWSIIEAEKLKRAQLSLTS